MRPLVTGARAGGGGNIDRRSSKNKCNHDAILAFCNAWLSTTTYLDHIYDSEEDGMMLILLTETSESHDPDPPFLLGGHFVSSCNQFIVGCPR